jgi:hypothetical protein
MVLVALFVTFLDTNPARARDLAPLRHSGPKFGPPAGVGFDALELTLGPSPGLDNRVGSCDRAAKGRPI